MLPCPEIASIMERAEACRDGREGVRFCREAAGKHTHQFSFHSQVCRLGKGGSFAGLHVDATSTARIPAISSSQNAAKNEPPNPAISAPIATGAIEPAICPPKFIKPVALPTRCSGKCRSGAEKTVA